MGWIDVKLGELAEVLRGVSYRKEDSAASPGNGLVPILRATNIGETLTFADCVFVPRKYVSDEQFLHVGDIVIAASSGSRSVVGKAAILHEPWKGSFGAFCYALRPSKEIVPRFVAYFLQTQEYRQRVSTLSAGVNINNLRRQHIEGIPFRLAPLAEQRRIVAEIEKQFTRLEAAVAALKRVQANLKRYRAAVLKAAVEGRLVPTEAELARTEGRSYEPASELLKRILAERRARWEADQLAKFRASGKVPKEDWKAKYKEPVNPTANLPTVPEGWSWATVDQLAALEPNAITDGPFGSNLKTEHYTPEGPRVVRLQNIGDGIFVDERAHISDEHYARLTKHRVTSGDIVIAALGERPPRSCIVPDSLGPAIVKADCVRFRPDSRVSLPKYLNCALNAEPTKNRTAAIVHGVGRPRLNLGEIKSISLPLPPLTEQQRIVAELERRLSVIDELEMQVEANLKRSERLRQAILKRAFEGKLVPQDPDDEPASILLERIRAEREATKQATALTKKTKLGKRAKAVAAAEG